MADVKTALARLEARGGWDEADLNDFAIVESLIEQLEAANRALNWYEEHRDSEGNYDGLMFGPLDAISNPTSGERVAAGMPSSTSATAGASQSPEDSSPASSSNAHDRIVASREQLERSQIERQPNPASEPKA